MYVLHRAHTQPQRHSHSCTQRGRHRDEDIKRERDRGRERDKETKRQRDRERETRTGQRSGAAARQRPSCGSRTKRVNVGLHSVHGTQHSESGVRTASKLSPGGCGLWHCAATQTRLETWTQRRAHTHTQTHTTDVNTNTHHQRAGRPRQPGRSPHALVHGFVQLDAALPLGGAGHVVQRATGRGVRRDSALNRVRLESPPRVVFSCAAVCSGAVRPSHILHTGFKGFITRAHPILRVCAEKRRKIV